MMKRIESISSRQVFWIQEGRWYPVTEDAVGGAQQRKRTHSSPRKTEDRYLRKKSLSMASLERNSPRIDKALWPVPNFAEHNSRLSTTIAVELIRSARKYHQSKIGRNLWFQGRQGRHGTLLQMIFVISVNLWHELMLFNLCAPFTLPTMFDFLGLPSSNAELGAETWKVIKVEQVLSHKYKFALSTNVQ